MSRPSSFVRYALIAVAGITASSFGACNCDDALTQIPTAGIPVGNDQGRVLTYVGDEPLAMFFAQQAQLRFTRKNADGSPVEGDQIKIEVHGSAVTVPGDSFITDVGGGVEIPAIAGTAGGEATVVARATDVDGSIDEAVVHISVSENPSAGIIVTVDSQTRIPVASANIRVLNGANPPLCADLSVSPEPAPTATATVQPLPGTHTFEQLTAHSMAVVVVDGFSAEGAIIASGCAQAGPLPGGLDTPVHVTLGQANTKLAGDYDVLMHMALGDALPHPYDTDVDLVTALLADPAGFALYFVLREIDRQTGFTTFVTHNGIELSYDEVSEGAAVDPGNFPTWSFARDQLNTFLTNQLGQTYTDVTNVGAGLRDIVTDFEVGTRLHVDEDTTDASALHVTEAWNDLVLYWPLPCAAGDLACARRPVTLDDLNLSPVTSAYDASYVYAPQAGLSERYAVTTDPHGMNLRYGALLVAILENVVFPSLPGGSPGMSFGDFLQNLVGCGNIAASVTSDPNAAQFVEGVCDAGLQIAGGVVENQLEQLQIDATDPTVQGLQSAGTFTLVDEDQDLTTEIVSEYNYAVDWNNPNDPAATQDISAPITGDGLRARPVCVDDTQCGLSSTALVCAPRPSYLKVAQVELGCDRAKGDLTGGTACVGDAQCASGVCAPTGVAGALQCFKACETNAACGAEVCGTGATMDLDTVLNGLGDVAVQGCAAP